MNNPNNLEFGSSVDSRLNQTGLEKHGLQNEFDSQDFDSSVLDASELNLKRPSAELDQRVLNMARSVPVQQDNGFNPGGTELGGVELANERPVDRTRFGWPTLISTAVAASLFGIVVGNSLNSGNSFANGGGIPSTEVAVVSPESKRPKQTLASVEIQAGVEKFNMLHGHSSQAEFSDCSACHMQTNIAEKNVSAHKAQNAENENQENSGVQPLANELDFYNPHILLRAHPAIPKCSNCHVAATPKLDNHTKPIGG